MAIDPFTVSSDTTIADYVGPDGQWAVGPHGPLVVSAAIDRLRSSAGSYTFGQGIAPNVPTTTNYGAAVDFVFTADISNAWVYLIAHYDVPTYGGNCYRAGWAFDKWEIGAEASTSNVLASSSGGSYPAGHTYRGRLTIETTGSVSTLNFYVDDVLVVGPVTDSTYPLAGRAGVMASQFYASDTQGIHYDNFEFLDPEDDSGPGPLAAGTLSVTAHTSSSVSLGLTGNSGGTSPYANQLRRAPDVSGSPGTYADVGSPATGATATWTDSGRSTSTTYHYQVVVTDSAGSPATADSNAVSQTTDGPTPPTAGTLSLTSSSPAGPILSWTNATGGTGTLAYDLYRSTTINFVPDDETPLATGVTSPYTDATAVAGTVYFYKVRVTDDDDSTADTNQLLARKWSSSIVPGGIGDSLMAGAGLGANLDPLYQCYLALGANPRRVVSVPVNRAGTGSKAIDWTPTATGHATYYDPAVAAFNVAGVTDAILGLAINDAINSESAATYGAAMAAIVDALFADVPTLRRVYLSYSTYISEDTAANGSHTYWAKNSLLVEYQAELEALDNGDTIRVIGRDVWPLLGEMGSSAYQTNDNIHWSATAAALAGRIWARDIEAIEDPPATVAGSVVDFAY